jgi:hypothetical protein
MGSLTVTKRDSYNIKPLLVYLQFKKEISSNFMSKAKIALLLKNLNKILKIDVIRYL